MVRRYALSMVAVVLIAGGAGGPAPAAVGAPAGTLTLYTSESEDKINEMVGDFQSRTPGVRVKIFRAGTGPVLAKLQAELQAGRPQADVIWFADIEYFDTLAKRDLLLAYAPRSGIRIPREYQYAGGRYHEVRLIFNVVAYNTRHVRFKPTSWWDLTLPRYRGRAAMPSPFVSGAAFSHVGTLAARSDFGWDFYRKLKENNALVLRANGDVIQKLASGEVSIVQVVDFFVRDLKAQGSPVDHIWPREGAVLVPTPIAIFKTSDNQAAGKAFLDYLYTPEAQRLFVKQGYISVVPGFEAPKGTPDTRDLKVIQTNLEYIRGHREEIRRNFGALFGGQ